MPGNDAAMGIRRAKVAEKRLQGKNFRTIAKEVGVSKDTAWTDWKSLRQDQTIKDMVERLKNESLIIAVEASSIEKKYMKQMDDKDSLTSQEAAVVSSMKVSNQKGYSTLAGDVTDEKGGLNIVLDD